MKLPISAMVVGFNEEKLLAACLQSISFCDEIIYTDLGSSDKSIEVAKPFASQILTRPIAPSGEYIQSEIVKLTKHDWVLFIDPDEVVDPQLAAQIQQDFEKITSNESIGGVEVPWQFYFKEHRLAGTVWGGPNTKYLLVNKHRFHFLPVTHYGRRLMEGYSTHLITMNKQQQNVLHHYWMNSYKIFFRKHKRYLNREGRDNYNLGIRMGIKKLIKTPAAEFYKSYFKCKGYKDGIIGLVLSAFWAYYRTYIALDLLHIQKNDQSFFEEKTKGKK